ncbi:hypothetical protein M3I53_10890 [Paraburkholderia sp. CNPSo 3272]|nr:hypothetical protein [Paraburkholderia sp. CNPSo 3272]MCP3723632.1 hypothetical protein [Paraburkholderia sp. CNPSo 3272]
MLTALVAINSWPIRGAIHSPRCGPSVHMPMGVITRSTPLTVKTNRP